MANQRRAIIAAAEAKGIDKDATRALLTEYGLTPKLIKTVFEQQGITQAENEARNLADGYNRLPKKVRTEIAAFGGDATRRELQSIRVDGEKLSGKQIRLILDAQDNASVKINGVKAKVQQLNGQRAVPILDANGNPASSQIANVMRRLGEYDGQSPNATLNAQDNASGTINSATGAANAFAGTYTATLNTVYVTTGTPAIPYLPGNADGNIHEYFAAGGMRRRPKIGDQQPQIRGNHGPGGITWAETGAGPWEGFVSGHPAKRDRSRAISDEIVRRLGGSVEWYAGGGIRGDGDGKDGPSAAHVLAQLLKAFNIGDKTTFSEAKSEMQTLVQGLKEEFGANSAIVKRIGKLGDHLVAEVKDRERLRNAIDKQTDELKDLRQQQRQYAQTVAGNFRNDPFAEGNSLQDALTQSRADANDATRFKRLLRKAKKLGLDGKTFSMLAASGNLGILEDLDTRKEVKRLERAVKHQLGASGQLGGFAGNTVFGQQIREQVQEVRKSNQHLRDMNRKIRHIEHMIDRGKIGKQMGRGAQRVVRENQNQSSRMTAGAYAIHGDHPLW